MFKNSAAADDVLDYYNDGGDFCDAVRTSAHNHKISMVMCSRAFKEEFGELYDGYEIEDFRRLDNRARVASKRKIEIVN